MAWARHLQLINKNLGLGLKSVIGNNYQLWRITTKLGGLRIKGVSSSGFEKELFESVHSQLIYRYRYFSYFAGSRAF